MGARHREKDRLVRAYAERFVHLGTLEDVRKIVEALPPPARQNASTELIRLFNEQNGCDIVLDEEGPGFTPRYGR